MAKEDFLKALKDQAQAVVKPDEMLVYMMKHCGGAEKMCQGMAEILMEKGQSTHARLSVIRIVADLIKFHAAQNIDSAKEWGALDDDELDARLNQLFAAGKKAIRKNAQRTHQENHPAVPAGDTALHDRGDRREDTEGHGSAPPLQPAADGG